MTILKMHLISNSGSNCRIWPTPSCTTKRRSHWQKKEKNPGWTAFSFVKTFAPKCEQLWWKVISVSAFLLLFAIFDESSHFKYFQGKKTEENACANTLRMTIDKRQLLKAISLDIFEKSNTKSGQVILSNPKVLMCFLSANVFIVCNILRGTFEEN